MTGLWALSAGAAKRGICHQIREDGDPLKKVMREANMPTSKIIIAEEISSAIEDLEIPVKEHLVLTGNQFVVVYNYYKHLNGQKYLSIQGVFITPKADRKKVADQIRNLKI